MARNCGKSSSCRLWRQRRRQLQDTNSHSDKRLFLSSLPNHYHSSLSRSLPKKIETCFYSKLEVNLGCVEIVATSTTIKLQMTKDICGGGIGRVVRLKSFARFSAIFRLSSLRVFQNRSTIFRPSAILFTFYMLWLYDVVTFYVKKHGEKKAEKSRKIAQSFSGGRLYRYLRRTCLFIVVDAATISMHPKFTSSLE